MKLKWYLLLTKDIVTVLWKKQNGEVVCLLVIFYATALYNNVCAHMCAVLRCSVKLKLASLATVAKWSLEIFNSA